MEQTVINRHNSFQKIRKKERKILQEYKLSKVCLSLSLSLSLRVLPLQVSIPTPSISMSKDHITQQILPELEESATSQGPKQDDGEVVAADELVPSDQEECKTPTSSNHKIPTIRSCPPTPKKKVQKLFLNKRKLPEMDFFEAANRDEVESFFRSSFELARVEYRRMKRRCRSH
ncbi:hypothetical protein P3X46_009950 [Hevea brasiliensis]|uniref:Uncharacterized protein n=1 Tax=Hevea brasiliensis TaxID=3981 RepID=A0ABQ9MGC8_HEVBR|nr:cyclin-dependent protein kinase inhibitor SMR2 [Hevea brasiliensis]KAJ9178030.1 hypothetical protein P3X46_009950 [Hevea brasiliensis]